MDLYSAEKVILERHRDMTAAAEQRSRLYPLTNAPLRLWMAGRLRSLADRLDGSPRMRASANLTPPRLTG